MAPPPPPLFCPPSILSNTSAPQRIIQSPLQNAFAGDWFLLRSSNPFWTDKRNVRIRYTNTATHIDDQAFYQLMTSDTIKCMEGKDTPSDDGTGIFTWQGKGFMRIASANWEVLSFTSRLDDGDWMLVYAHKSIFTSPAVNLMCRKKAGVGATDMQCIRDWMAGIKHERFQGAVERMVDIVQE